MKGTFKFLTFLMCVCCSVFCISCGDDNNDDEPTGDNKPVIANLAVSPTSVSYGNSVVLSGNFSDQKGLQSYTIKLSNAGVEIYETMKMLTGKTFALNDNQVIVLPKNAKEGDVTISVTLKNSDGNSVTQEVVLKSVKVPVFEKLYLLLGTKVCTLDKVENVFVYEDLIAAKATGKIYVNSDKTGMYWGNQSGAAATMVDGDFVIGKDAEANLKVTFNPATFELTVEESAEHWVEINEPLYILGNIARDNSTLNTEREVAKMQGYKSGNKKYWAWVPGDEWWGAINAGAFRFKIGGAAQYILYKNHTIVTEGSDDADAGFVTTVDGHVGIKVFYDGTAYNKISVEEMDWDGTVKRTLDYLLNGAMNVNGTAVPTAITFAGAPLALKAGTHYTFEGTLDLTKDQNITAAGVNLSTANPDPDVFTGKGNNTWKVVGNTGKWLIRIDPFAATIYACLSSAYPDAIYMDGWSWAKFAGDPGNVWNPENRLTLQRKSTDGYVYEGTFHFRGWGGDVNFWYGYYTDPDLSKKRFLLKYFDGITTSTTATNMTIPGTGGDAYDGYFKVSVDLKDGFTFDAGTEETGPDGPVLVLTPANGKKFTVTFTPVQ